MAFPIEINPFELTGPSNAPIKSITVGSNLDWFSIPPVITGESAALPISAKIVNPLLVFGTLGAAGVPSMISLTPAHIPTIELDQVSGLQDAINSLVKTLASANALLSVSNNGIGGYTLTVNTGTSGSTVAIGNDTRFPAPITGLRKGAGVASLDVVAVAKVDYWDTTVFVASGASHAKGLVPDPGASAGTVKYLREDATWQTPAGSGTVTSIGLIVPPEYNVSGSPVTTSGNITISRANTAAHNFMAGPTSGSPGLPSFRAVVYTDLSSIVGTIASTLAAGNDSRFPANVTGLRKSSGAASTDIAAVAKTDYWDTTLFSNGPGHQMGLVPDPGNTGTTIRYLREDGTWQTFTPGTNTVLLSMLATQADKTLLANASGGTASPSVVTAKTARSSSLLNLESVTTFGNANYTGLATDKYISTSVNFTATRTVTLPLANTFNAGQTITISDDFGAINGAFVLNIARSGADTIQGSSSPLVMSVPKGSWTVRSDGVNKWSIVSRTPSVNHTIFISSGTYTTPIGVKAIFVEALGGGGGGGGALGAGSQAGVGSGGGAAGYGNILITTPGSSYVITIGTGGAGGVGAASGASGNSTTFGSDLNCSGGNGGASLAAGTSLAFVDGGFGQYIGAGDWGSSGGDGGYGIRLSGTSAASGNGAAASVWSGITRGRTGQGDGSGGGGTRHFGGGGAGALSLNTTPQNGGDGVQGVVIVTEYY